MGGVFDRDGLDLLHALLVLAHWQGIFYLRLGFVLAFFVFLEIVHDIPEHFFQNFQFTFGSGFDCLDHGFLEFFAAVQRGAHQSSNFIFPGHVGFHPAFFIAKPIFANIEFFTNIFDDSV